MKLDGIDKWDSIEQLWRVKADLVKERQMNESGALMTGFYVLDVPEFKPLIDAVRKNSDCSVHKVCEGYRLVEFNVEIEIDRVQTGLKPAVWFGCLTGGLDGKITAFDKDILRIVPTNEPPLTSAKDTHPKPSDF